MMQSIDFSNPSVAGLDLLLADPYPPEQGLLDHHEDEDQGQQPRPADKPYHSKRPHKKSRSGCKNCKARKVKCDEARPACRSCVLRKADCVYPSAPAGPSTSSSSSQQKHRQPASSTPASPVVSHGSPAALAIRSRSQTPTLSWSGSSVAGSDFDFAYHDSGGQGNGIVSLVVSEPQFRPASVDELDMKLLWFYTTHSFSSFSTNAGRTPVVDSILKVRIPQEAFQKPFLMSCLLGLSALQLQNLHQDLDPNRALAHRANAFEGYRQAIEAADPDSFPALLATSLLLTALSSQMFRDPASKELYILDWMVVWRGIGLMVEMISAEKLWESGMAPLFFRPAIDLNQSAKHIPNHLLFMVSSIQSDDKDHAHVDDYYETLKYLGSLYRELQMGFGPILNLRIITWFTFLPKEFIELARQKRPRALVIIAHYLVFTKLVKGLWWFEGIGNRNIPEVARYLGTTWESVMQVPISSISYSDLLDLARLLMDDSNWLPEDNFDKFEQFRDPRVSALGWVDDEGHPVDFTPPGSTLSKSTLSPGPESPKWTPQFNYYTFPPGDSILHGEGESPLSDSLSDMDNAVLEAVLQVADLS